MTAVFLNPRLAGLRAEQLSSFCAACDGPGLGLQGLMACSWPPTHLPLQRPCGLGSTARGHAKTYDRQTRPWPCAQVRAKAPPRYRHASRARRLCLAMAGHPRLGAHSALRALPDEVLQRICDLSTDTSQGVRVRHQYRPISCPPPLPPLLCAPFRAPFHAASARAGGRGGAVRRVGEWFHQGHAAERRPDRRQEKPADAREAVW